MPAPISLLSSSCAIDTSSISVENITSAQKPPAPEDIPAEWGERIKDFLSNEYVDKAKISFAVLKRMSDYLKTQGSYPNSIAGRLIIHNLQAEKYIQKLKKCLNKSGQPLRMNCRRSLFIESQEPSDIQRRHAAQRSIWGINKVKGDGIGEPGVNIMNTGMLYDINFPDITNEVFTVCLGSNPKVEEVTHKGGVILHAFNTKYPTLTQQADQIAGLGYGAVLIAPPFTWRSSWEGLSAERNNQWWWMYQIEDFRAVDNVCGNLQDLNEMVNALLARGIHTYIDLTSNFMGSGGGNQYQGGISNLQYPSDVILKERIHERFPGYAKSQQIVFKREDKDEELTKPFTAAEDFEEDLRITSDHEWNIPGKVQRARLGAPGAADALPKIAPTPKMCDIFQQAILSLKKIGIKGLRIDAAKHLKSEMISKIFTEEVCRGLYIFGEIIVSSPSDPGYALYMVPFMNQLHSASVYDFNLEKKLLDAFSWGGDLTTLAYLPGRDTPSPVPLNKALTFTTNHDLPNNGEIFSQHLFKDSTDEFLAQVWLSSIPLARLLMFSDGKVLLSASQPDYYKNTAMDWERGWQSEGIKTLITYNNILREKTEMWLPPVEWEHPFMSNVCLGCARGERDIHDEQSVIYTGLTIINKSDREVRGDWPQECRLKPGDWIDMWTGRIALKVNDDGIIGSCIKVPARGSVLYVHHDSLRP